MVKCINAQYTCRATSILHSVCTASVSSRRILYIPPYTLYHGISTARRIMCIQVSANFWTSRTVLGDISCGIHSRNVLCVIVTSDEFRCWLSKSNLLGHLLSVFLAWVCQENWWDELWNFNDRGNSFNINCWLWFVECRLEGWNLASSLHNAKGNA
jgi:hypothetical protein